MFSRVSVILFTGVCVADTPCPVHAGMHNPADTAADSMHPTGMHSC